MMCGLATREPDVVTPRNSTAFGRPLERTRGVRKRPFLGKEGASYAASTSWAWRVPGDEPFQSRLS